MSILISSSTMRRRQMGCFVRSEESLKDIWEAVTRLTIEMPLSKTFYPHINRLRLNWAGPGGTNILCEHKVSWMLISVEYRSEWTREWFRKQHQTFNYSALLWLLQSGLKLHKTRQKPNHNEGVYCCMRFWGSTKPQSVPAALYVCVIYYHYYCTKNTGAALLSYWFAEKKKKNRNKKKTSPVTTNQNFPHLRPQ